MTSSGSAWRTAGVAGALHAIIFEFVAPDTEVREVVERYFRADALGSADDLRSAFAPGATVLEKRGAKWVRLTPEALAARSAAVAADESRRVRRVESLSEDAGVSTAPGAS